MSKSKREKYGTNDQREGDAVVPLQRFAEKQIRNHSEGNERDALLHDFQLAAPLPDEAEANDFSGFKLDYKIADASPRCRQDSRKTDAGDEDSRGSFGFRPSECSDFVGVRGS